MAPQYTVSLFNSSGTLQAISQDFLHLVINRTVNAPDAMQVVYNSNSNNVQYLTYNAIVTVTRVDTDAGISAATEFSGIIRKIVRVVNDRTTYEVTAVGMLALLGDRIVAWPANVLNRSLFRTSPAETVLKNLFNFNIGSSATTANGRLLDGRITGMTTSATAGTGTNISIGVAGQNLLASMQKIADDVVNSPVDCRCRENIGTVQIHRPVNQRFQLGLQCIVCGQLTGQPLFPTQAVMVRRFPRRKPLSGSLCHCQTDFVVNTGFDPL